jgi:hypothetical protein
MTIFQYALVRAAAKQMTDQEREIAMQMAQLADSGNTAAEDELRKMIHEVLGLRRGAAVPARTASARGLLYDRD